LFFKGGSGMNFFFGFSGTLLNVFLLGALIFIDAFCYGYINEICIKGAVENPSGIFGGKLSRGIYEKFRGFWLWLMEPEFFYGGYEPIRYRIIQKLLEITFILISYFFGSAGEAAGLLLAHYFLTNEYGYYVLLSQLKFAKKYRGRVSWLTHWYQSGYWMLKEYNYQTFRLSAIIGLLILIISNFIKTS
jgi:hypothetical protein